MKLIHSQLIRHILISLIALITSVGAASAFDLSTYASTSALSQGTWVKISVAQTGIHFIPASTLRSWGFSDPASVSIHGYGGQRIGDVMTRAEFIDDLPQVQTVVTTGGIYFYASGPVTWKSVTASRYIQSLNPFSQVGYYFVTSGAAQQRAIPTVSGESSSQPQTTFYDRLFHEVDQYSASMTGHLLLGEDFRYTPSQTFAFNLYDRNPESTTVWMQTSFAAKTYNSPSTLTFTVNGASVPSSTADQIKKTENSSYYYGSEAIIRKDLEVSGDRLNLGLTHSSPVTVLDARLNYITINYSRQLKLRNGSLEFWLSSPAMSIAGASAGTHVWDVTDPLNINALTTTPSAGGVTCVNEYTGQRSYMAWDENATYPAPQFVSRVANQDLHSLEVPEMVIFTIGDWADQAERLAQWHRDTDSLTVAVIDQSLVFNEFASGSPDATAFRKLLKMFYDRGNANPSGRQLKYVLMMGRSFFDNRRLTPVGKALTYPTMPTWQSDNGLNDNDSYTTDDYLAMLRDGAGSSMGSEPICVAVGRMPVRSQAEAKSAVDKIIHYATNMPTGNWTNRALLIADDEDNGVHMDQTESLYDGILATEGGSSINFDKVYIDAFIKAGNNYPDAREKMFRLLNEGSWWWNYVGHASMLGWTHENLLGPDDINNLYLRRYPILYAATCDFLRWDNVNISGAEVMWHNNDGGIIAAISATRPVYISDNGLLTASMGREVARRGDDGQFRRIGDIYRGAKNGILVNGRPVTNSNKLRYVLMGDPAMRMVIPSNRIELTAINGKAIDPADPPTLMAQQQVTVEGRITDPTGKPLTDFDGIVSSVLYDAEKSTTTLSHGEGVEYVFQEQGSRLFAGNDSIKGGVFTIKIAMPSEIADNFRPAALNMTARSTDSRHAMSCFRDLYVYGTDPNAETDNIDPVIESYYLNHSSFKSGDAVNESPMVIAAISDNRGLNLSQAGVGHQMALYLDETESYTNVSQYYTPNSDGTVGGVINYPIEGLAAGQHTLRLRVWDTSFNYAESTIEFKVKEGLAPHIFDIYTDANPASVEANFYITHDRPDQKATVTVTVYNLMGAEVWSSSATGRSDMFKSSPVTWNLTGHGGARVGRGIYLYRASITTDGEQYTTATRRIAVTGH